MHDVHTRTYGDGIWFEGHKSIPGADRRADGMLSCGGWCASRMGASVTELVERRKRSLGLVTESYRTKGGSNTTV